MKMKKVISLTITTNNKTCKKKIKQRGEKSEQ